MTDAERLLAIEEIKRLFARRIRAMDTKDWALYDTCHAPDATLDSFGTLPARHKPPGSIARTDFKARRVIDDRKVFADMQAQMERARS